MAGFEAFCLHVLIMKLKYSLVFFLSENKIKETPNNNQIYSFFETLSCWTSIFDYFELRMQAYIIFLIAIVKMCTICCYSSFEWTVTYWSYKFIHTWTFNIDQVPLIVTQGTTFFIKGATIQIWKSHYMFVFIQKQCLENFAFVILNILELFAREVCKFLKT